MNLWLIAKTGGEFRIMNIYFCPLSGSSIVKHCSFIDQIFILSTPQQAQRLND